ncbi:hypothetical protein KXW98_007820 [Aspergillus fumigatus]|uniref:Uncharacterized protein n=1 Tax=Aspergillus fumigatus TaxID=746128 RepID=A0A229XYH0_ASPFM|nr:hypothetical protein CNMCM8714_005552 [Aspergillus fumigatus]KAF4272583.1 hypothetical protein CNMCM8057_006054 [Aspergillus fumigatus]KAF4278012.1 hypothetical protein CNMCM8689_004104 [Aspergillus fumigatus]KAF4286391.1 hypothetical protein CNMCM8686_004531 [Aspergillus fumigatus]KAH1271157.1 hypothetical protein KXX45_000983 [Aspergillus fumigatus]
MAIVLRRDCDANANSADCEKPVSDFLKTGVPGIIVGILVLIAICVCCYLLYRNKKRDAREAEDARRWNLDK